MSTAQGRITIRRKPRQGDPGIAGCGVRTTEWAEGFIYRNDEAETTGTRYIDNVIVLLGLNVHCYKCIKTHLSTQANKPANDQSTEFWQPFSNMQLPFYAPFIFAPNAVIHLLQGNQILIMNADGTTAKALISGNGIGHDGIRFAAGIDTSDLLNSEWIVDELGYMRSKSGKIAEFVISGNSLVSTYDETSGTAYPMIMLNWAGNSYDKKGFIPMRGIPVSGAYPFEYRGGGAFNVVENKRNMRDIDPVLNSRSAQAAYVVKSNRDMTGLNRDYGYVTNDINWCKRNFEQHSVAKAVSEDGMSTWHIDAIKSGGIWSDANLEADQKPEMFDFVYSSNWLLSVVGGESFSYALPHKGDLLRFINNSVSVFLHGEEPNLWHINNKLSFVFKIISAYDSGTFNITHPSPTYGDPNYTIWMNESGTQITGNIAVPRGGFLEILFCNGVYQLINHRT